MAMFPVGFADHSVILERYGICPLATDHLYLAPLTLSCCNQTTKPIQLEFNQIKFHTPEFDVADGTRISIRLHVDYSVDVSSGFYRRSWRDVTRTMIEDGIKDVISKVVIKNVDKMTSEEMKSLDLTLIDSMYRESKKTLQPKKINVTSLRVMDVAKKAKKVVQKKQTGIVIAQGKVQVQNTVKNRDKDHDHNGIVENSADLQLTFGILSVREEPLALPKHPVVDIEGHQYREVKVHHTTMD